MTFVTGTGDRYVGGTTSAKGTSKTPVRSAHATNEGVPGGTGTAPVVAAAPNLSRQPMPLSMAWDDCGFPAEADAEQIHQAFVTVVVTVAPDGSAKSVRVVDKDPGFGFGQLARRCALRRRYQPALDARGQPVTAPTRPIRIKFDR
jgi:protein TonB